MEATSYFERNVLNNPDRAGITKEMCEAVVDAPEHSERQSDGRFRFWGRPEGRETYLHVIATALHNAFFDSNFTRKQRRER